MNKTRFPSRLSFILAVAFAACPHAEAASGTWNTNATGNWSDSTQWVDTIVADGAGDTANFSFTTGKAITLDGTSRTLGVLNISTTSGNYSFAASGGAILTMDNNGAQAQITHTGVGGTGLGSAISVPIQMTEGGLKITNASSALSVSGAITSIAESGVQILEISHSGGGLLSLGTISDGNNGGTVGVLLNGGITSMNSANSSTGGVTIRGGELRVSPSGLGDNALQLGDASSDTSSIRFAPTTGSVFANDITVGGGTGSVTIETRSQTEGSIDLNGTIDLGRSMTVNSTNGTVNLNGNISGAGALTIGVNGNGGPRTVSISGNNSFTGGSKLTGLSFLVNLGSATALGSGTVTIGAGATTHQTNLQIDNTSGAALTLAGNNPQVWSNFTFVGTNDLNLGTGAVAPSTTSTIVTVLDKKLTVGGIISNGASGNKAIGNAGGGTLVLAGANTYTGPTSVGGLLAVTSLADGGVASNIGMSGSAASNLVLNRGTLQYTGGAASTNRLFTVGNGGGALDSSGSGALNFTSTEAYASTDAVSITLAVASFAVGATIVTTPSNANTANLAVGMSVTGDNIPANTLITAILDGGRFVISNPTTGAGTASSYTFGALDRTLTLTGSNTGDNTLAGTLSDAATKTLGVTKAGTGKWILSGANIYTGATTVSGGNLQLQNSSGSATGTGVVLLSGGIAATLSGGGTSSGAATASNGTRIAPGLNTTGANSNFGNAGTLGVGTTGGLTLASANFDFDLASTATIGGGVNDLLTTGALSLAGSTVAFTFNGLNGTLATGTAYTLFQSTGIAGFNTATFSTTFLGALAGNYAASYAQSGNDLQVTFTAVPEPETWAMLIAGAGLLVIARRRHGFAL